MSDDIKQSISELRSTVGVLLQRVDALQWSLNLMKRDDSERHAALLERLGVDDAPRAL
jgi:hypothetical protein